MPIEELKKCIENKSIGDDLIIFHWHDTDFIPTQYYREIAKIRNLQIEVLNSIEELINPFVDVWGSSSDINSLKVLRVESLDIDAYIEDKNTVIITHNISNSAKSVFKNNIIDVPKLEEWQIKDYAYSLLPNVNKSLIDSHILSKDIYKVSNEIDRVKLFGTNEAFNLMISDGCFDDKCDSTLFDFTNALFKKDLSSVVDIYKKLDKIDYSEYGLLSLLYNGFRNIILVQLSNNPTPETCGLSNGQFWAIKKNNIGYYTKEQLIKIFREVSSIDKKIKTGNFDIKILVDYLIVFILSI